MNGFDAALKLIGILVNNRKISARKIMDELEVSKATAFRYMAKLKENFFLSENDSEDGAYTINSRYTAKKTLQKYEADFISSLVNNCERAIKSGGKNDGDSLNGIYMFIGGNSAGDADDISENIRIIHSCIVSNEKCSFLYREKKSKYTVEPYKILYTDDIFYMLCVHDKIIKTFRLDKMKQILKTGEIFIPDKNVPLKYSKASTIWYKPEKTDKVIIKIKPKVAHYFKTWQILPEQKIVKEFKNGSINIEFKSSSVIEFQKLLLGWFGSFEKVRPKKYSKYINSLIQNYKRAPD